MIVPSRIAELFAELAALSVRRADLERQIAAAFHEAPVTPPSAPAAPLPEYLTTAEAAELLGVSAGHLKALRAEGRGPHHVRIGRVVRYPREGLRSMRR